MSRTENCVPSSRTRRNDFRGYFLHNAHDASPLFLPPFAISLNEVVRTRSIDFCLCIQQHFGFSVAVFGRSPDTESHRKTQKTRL